MLTMAVQPPNMHRIEHDELLVPLLNEVSTKLVDVSAQDIVKMVGISFGDWSGAGGNCVDSESRLSREYHTPQFRRRTSMHSVTVTQLSSTVHSFPHLLPPCSALAQVVTMGQLRYVHQRLLDVVTDKAIPSRIFEFTPTDLVDLINGLNRMG